MALLEDQIDMKDKMKYSKKYNYKHTSDPSEPTAVEVVK